MGRKKVFPPVVRVHRGRERVSHNRTWYDLGPVQEPHSVGAALSVQVKPIVRNDQAELSTRRTVCSWCPRFLLV